MKKTPAGSADLFLQLTRRTMLILLALILALGIMSLAMTITPDGEVTRFLSRAPWLLPILIVMAAVFVQAARNRHGFSPDSPAVRRVMEDELRKSSLDRARVVGFLSVLASQIPLALLFAQSPGGLGLPAGLSAFQAVMAMAVSTITLGMAVFITSFLVFDRG